MMLNRENIKMNTRVYGKHSKYGYTIIGIVTEIKKDSFVVDFGVDLMNGIVLKIDGILPDPPKLLEPELGYQQID